MDKFRTLFPIPIVTTAGELLDYRKVNAIATETKQGLGLVEHVLGDLWNQSGDTLFSTLPNTDAVMVPNIARFLGTVNDLNPDIPYLGSQLLDYGQPVGTSYAGLYEGKLDFLPQGGTSYTWTGTSKPTTEKASKDLIQAAGDFYVDPDTGNFYSYNVVASNWVVHFAPIVNGSFGEDTSWNVIPDLRTDSAETDFLGLKIQQTGTNTYSIYLPPRGSLVGVTVPFFRNYGTVGEKYFWLDSTIDAPVDATSAPLYRYNLPPLLTDNWSAGITIPEGYLYLWDSESGGSGTFIEGVTFVADANDGSGAPPRWKLIASGSNLTAWLNTAHGSGIYDAGMLASADHAASLYPKGLRLVVIGNSLSAAISNLKTKVTDLTGPVKHSTLLGNHIDNPTYNNPYINNSPILGDDHSQYLERHGYNTSRDKYKNMMVGDLLLSSIDSTTNYENILDRSYMLKFNDHTYGASVFGIEDNLKIVLGGSATPSSTSNQFLFTASGLDLCFEASPITGLESRLECGSLTNGCSLTIGLPDTRLFPFFYGQRTTVIDPSIGHWSHEIGSVGPLPVGIIRCVGGSASETNGITLQETGASYQVKERTDDIVIPLGPIFQNGLLWAQGNLDGSYHNWAITNTIGAVAEFFISDFPIGMQLNSIEVDVYSGTSDGLKIQVDQWQTMTGGHLGADASQENLYPLTAFGGLTASFTNKSILMSGSPSPWTKQFLLKIMFIQNTNTEASAFRPWIKLNCTYSTVSSFQPIP